MHDSRPLLLVLPQNRWRFLLILIDIVLSHKSKITSLNLKDREIISIASDQLYDLHFISFSIRETVNSDNHSSTDRDLIKQNSFTHESTLEAKEIDLIQHFQESFRRFI